MYSQQNLIMKQLKRCKHNNEKSFQEEGPLCKDILVEILQRLPLSTLMEFQRVSKSWQSIIKDPSFKLNTPNSTHPYSIIRHLCLYNDEFENQPARQFYALEVVEPEFYRVTFERHSFDSDSDSDSDYCDSDHRHISAQLHKFIGYQGLGSSNGLICYSRYPTDVYDMLIPRLWEIYLWSPRLWEIYLWNPSINRCKKVSFPPPSWDNCSSHFRYQLHKVGFGFCGVQGYNDYKLVDICFHHELHPSCLRENSRCPGHVFVYSLVSDSWKSPRSNSMNVPRHLATYTKESHRWGTYAFVGGVYYWLISCHDGVEDSFSIVAFDLVNEKFVDGELKLPKLFRPSCAERLYLFEFGESVALYEAADEFRKGCLWVSTTHSTSDRKAGKLTWVKLFSVVVDETKDLLKDNRLPHPLQMMLKYGEYIENLDSLNFCYKGVPYYTDETTYDGTYVKSLALHGVGSKPLPYTEEDTLDPEDLE